MTAAKRWIAAGATTAMLTGGLFLGAPSAVAAPGDPACLQATAQLDAALAGAGLTPESLATVEVSADSLAAAEAQYAALVEGAGGPALQELEAAAAALAAAQQSGDPQAVAAAQARVAELDAQLAAALGTLDPAVVEQAVADAAVGFEALLGQLALDEATAGRLLVLLEQAAVACQAPAVPAPVAPAPVVAPVAPAPAAPAPVEAAPVAPLVQTPAESAPAAVNPGLNMQAGATAPEQRPGAGVLVGLLAAGAVVSTAVALRLRRRA